MQHAWTLLLRFAALVAVHAFTWWGTIVVAVALAGVSLALPANPVAVIGAAVAVSIVHTGVLCAGARAGRLRGWALAQLLGWSYALLAVADPSLWAATVSAASAPAVGAFAVGGIVGLAVVVPVIVWLMDLAGNGTVRVQQRDLVPRLGLRDMAFRIAVIAAVVVPGLAMAMNLILPADIADPFWSADRYPVLALRGLIWVAALLPLVQTLPRRNVTVLGIAASAAVIPASVLSVAAFGVPEAAIQSAVGTAPVAFLAGVVISVWFRPRSL